MEKGKIKRKIKKKRKDLRPTAGGVLEISPTWQKGVGQEGAADHLKNGMNRAGKKMVKSTKKCGTAKSTGTRKKPRKEGAKKTSK